ncbi:hypothetical protein D3C71_2090620 [compost metagenome]
MGVIRIAHLKGNIRNPVMGLPQQLLGPLHPAADPVVDEGFPCHLLEQLAEI